MFEPVLSRTNATNSIKCIYWPMQKRIDMLYCIGKRNAIGVLLPFSLSPRGDGNVAFVKLILRLPIFFIPARGRKHFAFLRCRLLQRFSLSPRGDGNLLPLFLLPLFPDFLYPREGTETTWCRSPCLYTADFLYPRKGTETASGTVVISNFYLIFFIPARGRKQQVVVPAKFYLRFSLSPRGDGNLPAAHLVSDYQDFLYPRKGPPFPTKIDIFAIHLFTNSA